MTYRRGAAASLEELPRHTRRTAERRLRSLAHHPTPRWAGRLYWGEWEGYWHFRLGGVYRVIYDIDFRTRRVEVARVGHRNRVYRMP